MHWVRFSLGWYLQPPSPVAIGALRAQVLVEVETRDGGRHSLMLQNAETVKLVGPQQPQPQRHTGDGSSSGSSSSSIGSGSGSGNSSGSSESMTVAGDGSGCSSSGSGSSSSTGSGSSSSSGSRSWRAISVSALQPGDCVYVLLQAAARHTGIAIEEFVVEK